MHDFLIISEERVCHLEKTNDGFWFCPVCKWVSLYKSVEIPIRECPAKMKEGAFGRSTEEILLSYLTENQPLTMGALVEDSKCGCQNRGRETVEKLIIEGKIRRDDSMMPPELWVV